MAIYSFPSTCFSNVQFGIRANSQSFMSPFTRQLQVQSLPGDQWHGKFTLPKMSYEQAGEWVAFLAKMRGRVGQFYAYDPSQRIAGNRGLLGAGAPALSSSDIPLEPTTSLTPSTSLTPGSQSFPAWAPDAIGDLELAVSVNSGLVNLSVTGFPEWDYSAGVRPDLDDLYFFKSGDYISIDDELKIVTDDVPYIPGGTANVKISPPLRSSYSAGQLVRHEFARGVFRLVDDEQAQWDVDTAMHFGMSFSIVEVI